MKKEKERRWEKIAANWCQVYNLCSLKCLKRAFDTHRTVALSVLRVRWLLIKWLLSTDAWIYLLFVVFRNDVSFQKKIKSTGLGCGRLGCCGRWGCRRGGRLFGVVVIRRVVRFWFLVLLKLAHLAKLFAHLPVREGWEEEVSKSKTMAVSVEWWKGDCDFLFYRQKDRFPKKPETQVILLTEWTVMARWEMKRKKAIFKCCIIFKRFKIWLQRYSLAIIFQEAPLLKALI